MTDQRAICSLIQCPILSTHSTRQLRWSVGLMSLLELGSFSANNFLLANNPKKYDFYDKTCFFIFCPFFLFPEQLSELKSPKSLRKSVRRSYLFLCFGSLSSTTCYLPSCTVIEPTAQYLYFYHCASALSVTDLSRCGLRASPAPRAISVITYCTHYNLCASALPVTVWSEGMPCTPCQ